MQLSGVVALGPISNAMITAYDFSSSNKGAVIKLATDVKGKYTLNLKSKSKPLLICSKGGCYTEAASTES